MYKIIKVASSLGAPQNKTGMENGPNILASALLKEEHKNLHSDLVTVNIPAPKLEHRTGEYEKAKNWPEIKIICCNLKEQVSSIIEFGYKPIVLMGDDSSAIGVVYGILQKTDHVSIVWFDAHGDINTPKTSSSGCFYGMGLAHVLGYGHPEILKLNEHKQFIDANNVIMIGQRNLDLGEKKFIELHHITKYSSMDLKKRFKEITKQIGRKLKLNNASNIFLHYDLDVIEPEKNPAVFSPTQNGLLPKELYKITEYLQRNFSIVGISIANYIPVKDKNNKGQLIVAGFIKKIMDRSD